MRLPNLSPGVDRRSASTRREVGFRPSSVVIHIHTSTVDTGDCGGSCTSLDDCGSGSNVRNGKPCNCVNNVCTR